MTDAMPPTLPARFAAPPLDAPLSAASSSIKKTGPISHPLEAFAVVAGGLAFIFAVGAVVVWLLKVFSPSELGDLEFVLFLIAFPVLSVILSIAAIVLALLALKAGDRLLWPGLTIGFAMLTLPLSWTLLGSYSSMVIYFFQDTGVQI
ncbi:hypothetical protein ICM05_06640 [Leucobacter sp. cx-42]|uniref:hypothetical protein n=1 Tax=unclassified Leucobacter TaxID=2621730 RepID=UPI00165DF718|nr:MULTISPECIES: hypothetical protein [unclassified Leucobacter]MBC9954323.1 hypothetical protein [Leucobacter sp. cx-42]